MFTYINGFQYVGQEDRRPCLSWEIWLQSGQASLPVLGDLAAKWTGRNACPPVYTIMPVSFATRH